MQKVESTFNPPASLCNAHLQILLSSSFLRKWPLQWRARHLARQAEDVILECSDGIRLHGLYNPHPTPTRGLAILLHGWEGCAESMAVCPVLDPLRTMNALENGSQIYHRYFLHRWKRSLAIKLEHFPELGYGDSLLHMQSLSEMNAYFVPKHTGFNDPESYYNAYALTGKTLAGLEVPAHIILSQDDPMIPVDDLDKLAAGDCLTLETPRYGGHCGFMKDWFLRGWIDDRLLELLAVH